MGSVSKREGHVNTFIKFFDFGKFVPVEHPRNRLRDLQGPTTSSRTSQQLKSDNKRTASYTDASTTEITFVLPLFPKRNRASRTRTHFKLAYEHNCDFTRQNSFQAGTFSTAQALNHMSVAKSELKDLHDAISARSTCRDRGKRTRRTNSDEFNQLEAI